MAAFGILAALRERDGGGAAARRLGPGADGRRVDGRRRAVVAGDGGRALASPTASCRAAATSSWPAALICYRPYECADGWVTLGALEPKFWAAWCRGRRPRGPDRAASSSAPGRSRTPRCRRSSRSARARSGRPSPPSTTAAWSRCSTSTRRWTPSSCARARWWSRSTSPGSSRAGAPARAAGQARPHARRSRAAARPRAGRAHRRGAAPSAAISERGDRRAARGGRRRRARRRRARARSWHERRLEAARPRRRRSTPPSRGC